MKVVIKKTNCPDLIIVNGKAVNFINGKIDLLEFIKKRDILNDAEIKAAENHIKPKFKKCDSKKLKKYIKGLHQKSKS